MSKIMENYRARGCGSVTEHWPSMHGSISAPPKKIEKKKRKKGGGRKGGREEGRKEGRKERRKEKKVFQEGES
jgi:hypothetical protein